MIMIKIKKKICKYSLKYVISDLLNVVERDQDDQDQDHDKDEVDQMICKYLLKDVISDLLNVVEGKIKPSDLLRGLHKVEGKL